MDARTIELNRIGDLLKKAFDGRYNNEPLSNHQKPVSVVPNRDFALQQFEFAKIAKKPISQTRVQKPADLESYWSESTIDLIRKLVKDREQYKQNSELVNVRLNNNSSDAANNKEIVKLKQELLSLETMKKMNEGMNKMMNQLTIENKKLKTQNEILATELKKCNENNKFFITDYEEYTAEVDKTQNEFKENIKLLTEELKQKNAEIGQLKTSNKLVEQENKFKLEKAQMDIMFGMKMDLIKKQFENTIANISNSSNADLIKQNNNLTTEKQTYEQTIRNNKEENKRLSNELIQAQTTNKTQKQAMSSQANTDKAKIAQLQTRVIKLTQELLIMKMNENLQKYANVKPTAAPTTLDRTTFVKREFIGINMKGGAPKQKIFMKGGAFEKLSIEFDDTEEFLVIFNKSDKSLIQNPNDPKMTYCTVEMITEYNNNLKELKDENDSLKKSSQSFVATLDSDAMNKLTAKLIALQTLYKDSQNNLRNEQIKNALNSSIQSTLKSSLTNPKAIEDLTKENDNLKADKSKLEAEKDTLTKAIEDLTKEKDALKTEKADLTSAKTGLEGEKTGLTSAKTNLEAKNKQLEAKKKQLETEITGLKNQLNSTSTSSGMSTVISNANATLRRIPKGFISDNGKVMFLEHK